MSTCTFLRPHLTEEVVDQCIQLAYDRGMEHIHPDKNHMKAAISLPCSSATPILRRP